MMVYIVCFVVSTLFLWLGTRHCTTIKMQTEQWQTAKMYKIPVAIGLLLPIFIASLRATSVGFDVEYYVVPYFNLALKANSFSSYLLQLGYQDIGYCFLNYILSRISSNIGWLFFVLEMINICFTFAACWKLRGIAYPWLSMLFFYLTFYNITLSTVRQSCSCAICFFAISIALVDKFEKKSIFRIIIYILLAILFHASAVVIIPILLLCYYISIGKLKPIAFVTVAAIICIVLRVFTRQFFQAVSFIMSFISSKYTKVYFLNNQAVGASGYTKVIAFGAFVLLIQYAIYKKEKRGYWKGVSSALLGLNIVYVFAMMTLSSIAFIPRLLYYIEIIWALPLAQVGRLFPLNKANKTIGTLLTVTVAFIYWFLLFIIGGVHGTYPYLLR